ncbi:esterase/lipase family protein [Gordonia crocea]|uniref:Lipase n=1 Tax=Gordonia crocea TaxID=589162 RepID=A0A7I9UZY5_9ACTN|nr:alpha/beta fold hydrolase [Gordonia crocea]GED98431.1 lipase [Gordonia crocea]
MDGAAGVLAQATVGIASTVRAAADGSRWPDGVNEWDGGSVTGSDAPVVLVPGSFVPGEFYWHRLVPGLIADGRRVFACNLPGLGTREPAVLVDALEEFLTRVRAATGTGRVVLVGQSFGGVVIRDLVRSTRADVVGVVLVSAQNHGFRRWWAGLFSAPLARRLVQVVCPMALRLLPGSGYLAELDATDPGVAVTTITSRRDVFAAPESVRVSGGNNIVLQDLDPRIRSGHMLIGFDPMTVDLIRAAVRNAG